MTKTSKSRQPTERQKLLDLVARTIHGRMHGLGKFSRPYNPNFVDDSTDFESELSYMSAADAVDAMIREGYSIVKN